MSIGAVGQSNATHNIWQSATTALVAPSTSFTGFNPAGPTAASGGLSPTSTNPNTAGSSSSDPFQQLAADLQAALVQLQSTDPSAANAANGNAQAGSPASASTLGNPASATSVSAPATGASGAGGTSGVGPTGHAHGHHHHNDHDGDDAGGAASGTQTASAPPVSGPSLSSQWQADAQTLAADFTQAIQAYSASSNGAAAALPTSLLQAA